MSEQSEQSDPSSEPRPARYTPEQLLGHGGAGEVHRARDRATGRLVALKRLRCAPDDRRRADLALLFEREFHTLAQLRHPGIVEVYDYGVEAGEPYYTMELLDGSDLRDLAPLPWRRACVVLCEVASALALLHSRRLVHRDLSPRNVRVTSAGRSKLLDFGAMTAMGATRQLVGTPAYVAPEHVSGQELDARSDLFGLGALAYWTLTGRPAWRARTFKELAAAWLTRPLEPSALVADIPADLDALVLSLISIDPDARPASAGAVIARLRALSDQPGERPGDAHAYLSTPTLVGRSDALATLRGSLEHATQGRGSSVVIEGARGMGRSRMLAALVLEAKLAGALVLKASAADCRGDDYGLARALVDQLRELAPEHAPPGAGSAPEDPGAWRSTAPQSGSATPRLDALVDLICVAAATRVLCVAVDDVLSADTASIALLTRLSARAHGLRLLVAVSAESGGSPGLQRALDHFVLHGTRIALAPLDAAQSEALLRSVFGDVANLAAIAAWIHELSGGRPASCLELAQHLVDRGVARLIHGAWSLPYTLDGLQLPASYEQSLEQRIAALEPCSRALLELLALSTRAAPLAVADHLALLAPEFSHAQVFAALDQLVRERMIAHSEERTQLRESSLAHVVARALAPERRRALHAALARHHELHGGRGVLSYHLLHAGDFARSLAVHGAQRERASGIASPEVVFERSELGGVFLEQLYATAKRQRLSPRELFPLQKHLIALAAVANADHGRHVDDVLPRLLQDSGLVHYAEHADREPLERIVACMKRAQARHDATPEAERGLSPIEAVRELAVMVGLLTGLYARTMDTERAARLPAMLAPLVPLSPLIAMLSHLTTNSVEALLHATDVHQDRVRLLELLERPQSGLDEITRGGALQLLSFYQGLDYAARGATRALELAARLDRVDYYAPLACQVRVMYCLMHGDVAGVQQAREQREALALLHVDANAHLIRSSFYEVTAAYLNGDLVACRQLADIIAREALQHRGWRPWHEYANALVEALREDDDAALRAIERVFALCHGRDHAARVLATMLQVSLLARGAEPQRALQLGRELLARREAEQRPLTTTLLLDLGLALAEARCAQHASAQARLERAVAHYQRFGNPDVPLVLIAIERARVALLAGDQSAFAEHAERAARRVEALQHPGLIARLQQLIAEARSAQHAIDPALLRSAELTTSMTVIRRPRTPDPRARLAGEPDRGQRARLALELLMRDAQASAGCLFAASEAGLQLLADHGVPEPGALGETARSLLDRALASEHERTHLATTSDPEPEPEPETQSVNVLSHHGLRVQAFVLHGADRPCGVLLLIAPESSLLRIHAELLRCAADALALG